MGIVRINNFSGGIAKDTREPSTTKCAYSQNFDVLTYPRKLKPFVGMTANETTTYGLTDFLYGSFGSGISTNILAYGRQTGADRPELYMKSGDVVTGSWTTALTATGAASRARTSGSNLFHLYKGYVYFGCGARYIGRAGDLANGTAATLVDNFYDATSFTTVTQAITHPKDDIMYFGVDNKIYKNDSGTITLGLTLPTYLTVTSVTQYENYLAIACKVSNIIGNSIVYLWDRDSTLNTITESIDWGSGILHVLDNIDGSLIGVSYLGSTSLNLASRIIIKQYSGGAPVIIKELIGSAQQAYSSTLFAKKYKANNNLYFRGEININGTARLCLFVVGKDENGQWVVSGDINVNNDTTVTTIDGFVKFEDIWFVAYNTDGSVNRTVSNGTSTGTSIYESLVNPSMPLDDRHKHKKLRAISVAYEKIVGAGAVVLEYRVDGATSWTSVASNVANSFFLEATAESDGTPFADFREIEFRVESSGATITEIGYRYDLLTSQING